MEAKPRTIRNGSQRLQATRRIIATIRGPVELVAQHLMAPRPSGSPSPRAPVLLVVSGVNQSAKGKSTTNDRTVIFALSPSRPCGQRVRAMSGKTKNLTGDPLDDGGDVQFE